MFQQLKSVILILVICGLDFVWFCCVCFGGRINGNAVRFYNYLKYKGHTEYLLIYYHRRKENFAGEELNLSGSPLLCFVLIFFFLVLFVRDLISRTEEISLK